MSLPSCPASRGGTLGQMIDIVSPSESLGRRTMKLETKKDSATLASRAPIERSVLATTPWWCGAAHDAVDPASAQLAPIAPRLIPT
jgi:hypothetical protein